MDKRRAVGGVGLLLFGGATAAMAAGEIQNPKQANDFGKGLASIAVESVDTSAVSIAHFVPNATVGAEFDATPWEQVEEVVTNPRIPHLLDKVSRLRRGRVAPDVGFVAR